MQMLSRILGLALIAMALILTCSRDMVVDSGDGDPSTAKITIVAADVSDCGGFDEAVSRMVIDSEPSGESLQWAYDAETGTLDLHHKALNLNCCGVHEVDASYENGVVTVYENDQPEPDGGRCRCMCDFDFNITITGMSSGVTGIRIKLTIDDTTAEHWSGVIDPAEGEGMVIISGSPR